MAPFKVPRCPLYCPFATFEQLNNTFNACSAVILINLIRAVDGVNLGNNQMIKPVNGMKDLMHRAMPRYRKVIEETRSVLESRYGYQEVMPNLVESERLYRRTLGVTSDIVLKEMYEVVAASTSITDKSGKVKDRNVLRPEGTAGVLRAILRDTELM